jgi:hypothetical protein
MCGNSIKTTDLTSQPNPLITSIILKTKTPKDDGAVMVEKIIRWILYTH